MADNKSCEGMVTYKCMKCFAEMAVSKQRETRMDGRNCFLCKGPIQKVENKKSVGSFTVDIDCSDALKGLKAVQREARKATAALKELDHIKRHTCPSCGLISLDIATVYGDDRLAYHDKKCMECGWSN